jgi:hypothetical protein
MIPGAAAEFLLLSLRDKKLASRTQATPTSVAAIEVLYKTGLRGYQKICALTKKASAKLGPRLGSTGTACT